MRILRHNQMKEYVCPFFLAHFPLFFNLKCEKNRERLSLTDRRQMSLNGSSTRLLA